MKKFFATGLIFLFVFVSLYSQDAGKISLGARGGLQIGIGKIQDDFKEQLRFNECKDEAWPSGNLVLYGAFGITNKIGLQTELNFMINQGKVGRLESNPSYYIKVTYTSLDIPVLLKVNFLDSQARFGILGGPNFTFPLGKASTKYEGFINTDTKHDYDAPNLGFVVGLYGGPAFMKGRWVIDVRYVQDSGISTIKKWLNGIDIEFMHRRAIAITLGLEFFL